MIEEKPDDERWQELVAVYGNPSFVDRVWPIEGPAERTGSLNSSGTVVLLIFNLAGSCVFVKRKEASDWLLPMGRIGSSEGIIEAAIRVAMEEAGVKIIPLGVPQCQRITCLYNDMTCLRWYFVVVAETATSDLDPLDSDRIDEARLFDLTPSVGDPRLMEWMVELHQVGIRFMRSMDALDGI
ncbi:MAG TPA: NUDIX hydrolase [Methanomassiliicoccales archaeon]|jgi:8-oxo-dGTP pyrophosphatase MutT (NUDIX family)